ncbi:SDR family NAD(P)-dependent oxidoreductase [Kribbella sp. NPDC056951]|uniref:SDR family NAD(P)-dependent oxidoreductase n=1 Tax=Kribbella sp. NPDC056951 TaxID=3345978 RepID=UPI00363C7069
MLAVVVGAGGGIGGACARQLAEQYDTVLCVDRDLAAAERTVAEIASPSAQGADGVGPRAVALAADAADANFGVRVGAAAAEYGAVGCAVYAVAYEEHTPAVELSRESLLRSLTVGPVGAFEFFRGLTPAEGASYIAIGSLHETQPFAKCLGYNAAHGALGQVVRTLAHEWADRGIRVNAVVPGWIATPGEEVFHGAEALKAAGELLPFGRHGRPEEIAAAVGFLASEAAGYISGSFLTVDGALSTSLARLRGL